MAKRKSKKMTKRQREKAIKGVLTIICLIVLAVMWFFFKPEPVVYEVPDGTAEFHFIDIGQGDATLIKIGDKNILVDTGDRGQEDELSAYLEKCNVEKIEYFVITHFDTDHYYNAEFVLDNYDVVNVLIPNQVKTGVTYESFVSKMESYAEKDELTVLNANDMVGETINVESLELKILAPLKDDYDDSNDFSVVMMARYGNKKVLLTGDAEKESEGDMVERYSATDLDCDVLKVGHHGSATSSNEAFLAKAQPEYAVISCGVDNKHNHPRQEALDRLNAITGIVIYRTDLKGTILASISNDVITFTESGK